MGALVLHVKNGKVRVTNMREEGMLSHFLNSTKKIEDYLFNLTGNLTESLNILAENGFRFPLRAWTKEWENTCRKCYIIHDGKIRPAVLYIASGSNILTCLIKNELNLITPIFPENKDRVFSSYSDAYDFFQLHPMPEDHNDAEALLASGTTNLENNNCNAEITPQRFCKNRNLFEVFRNGKWGLENEQGMVVLAVNYEFHDPLSDCEFTEIGRGDYVGYIDSDGVIRIPVEYDRIMPFGERENTFAMKNGRWGIIDRDNNVVHPFDMPYVEVEYINGDYVTMQDGNDKWGLMYFNGIIDTPCVYDNAVTEEQLPSYYYVTN